MERRIFLHRVVDRNLLRARYAVLISLCFISFLTSFYEFNFFKSNPTAIYINKKKIDLKMCLRLLREYKHLSDLMRRME